MNRRESLMSAAAALLGIRPTLKPKHGPVKFCLSEPDFQALRKAVTEAQSARTLAAGCVEGQRAVTIDHAAAYNLLFAVSQGLGLYGLPDPTKRKKRGP